METPIRQGKSISAQVVPEETREKIKNCMQCGTCSGVCPAGDASAFSGPRKLFALILAGEDRRALESDFIWMCSSCYACTANCPQQIPVTDIIYQLKEASFNSGLAPRKDKLVRLIRSFSGVVSVSGRSHELAIMRKTLGLNVFEAYESMPLGIKLFKRGRIDIFGERIKTPKEIEQIFDVLSETE